MKLIFRKTIGITSALAMLAGPALAQQGSPHDQDHGPQSMQHPQSMHPQSMQHQSMHPQSMQHQSMQHQSMQHPEPQHEAFGPAHGSWHQGDHYNGGRQVVDWRQHHLHEPPSGYEWVQSGGQFVLIAVTTGIIASIIAGSAQ
jgi:Ni/Co efflux regulator RcnB